MLLYNILCLGEGINEFQGNQQINEKKEEFSRKLFTIKNQLLTTIACKLKTIAVKFKQK